MRAHKAEFSEGTISSCISAIAKDLNKSITTAPYGEPITIQESLRQYRSPIQPSDSDDTVHGQIEMALTQHSDLHSSSCAIPIMASIQEKASMDPYISTDETGNRVGGNRVQTSVAKTNHTTQFVITEHRDAKTLRNKWGFAKNHPAMRDGTKGYEWMIGTTARCWVHLLRATEEMAMQHGVGSPQYVRHRMLLDTYRDTVRVSDKIIKRAGGPVTCASQLDIVHKVPGLAQYVEEQIRRLIKQITKAMSACPPDSVTITLSNAIPNMFTALRVPGMPLHNNDIELIHPRCNSQDAESCCIP